RRHGAVADGGVTRLVYSAEWRAAMAEIEQWLSESGLAVRADAVGSRFGRLQVDSPSVVLSGSHTDSVNQGGAYDGALGVVMAGCAIRWLAGNIGRPRRTLEVFANCEEESSRFASNFWGSRAIAGRIAPAEVEALTDEQGESIGDAMRGCGLDPGAILSARRKDLHAFVEHHIEQGPVLVESGDEIGIVDQVPGEAAFTVDFRHPDDPVLTNFDQELRELIRDVGRRRGLNARLGQVVDQRGILFDGEICAALEASCVESGARWRRMPS